MLRKLVPSLQSPEKVSSLLLKKNSSILLDSLLPFFVNVEILDLTSSKLDSFPASICLLKNLKELKLGNNDISVIPDCICNLGKLERLELWDNNIYKLPDCLSEMSVLKVLDLYGIKYNREEQEILKARFPALKIMLSEPCDCHFD